MWQGTNAEDSQLVPFALVQSPHGITLTLTEEWLQSLNSPGAHGSAVEPGRGSSDQFLSQVFDARPLFSAKPTLPGRGLATMYQSLYMHMCKYM